MPKDFPSLGKASPFSIAVMRAMMCFVPCQACKSRNDSTEPAKGAKHDLPVANAEVSKGGAASGATQPSARPLAETETAAKTVERCLNAQEVAEYDPFGWKLKGQLSVVRVAQDDTLSLRQSPSPSAPIVSKLAYDQSGLEPTRRVCFVGATPWYELRVRGLTGWANSQYLAHTTTPHDKTSDYRKAFGALAAATPEDLVKRILQSKNAPPQTEGKYQAQPIDTQVRDNSATSLIHACCELDDSVAGEQTLITQKKTERGWQLQSAQSRFLCYRGATSDGTLCN